MVVIKLMVEGGKMTPSPAVAQQLGPMGVNIGKVISDVNEKTKEFSGMNVPVLLDVNPTTKNYQITVLSPPTAELIKKELGLEKGASNTVKVGNIAFERIISIASQKHDNMLSNDFLSSVKSVLGTCQSMGIFVDNKEVKAIIDEVDSGNYDAMIKARKTEVDEEKLKELNVFFQNYKKFNDKSSSESESDEKNKKDSGGKKT